MRVNHVFYQAPYYSGDGAEPLRKVLEDNDGWALLRVVPLPVDYPGGMTHVAVLTWAPITVA